MQPTLWHITISHYSEKARWALDYKSIPYRLRAPVPGAHIPVALWLTYGRHYTLPVLDLGGERIGDSTAITGGNALIPHVIVVDGQLVGTWRRTLEKDGVILTLDLLTRLSAAESKRVMSAARRFGEFVGLRADIRQLAR